MQVSIVSTIPSLKSYIMYMNLGAFWFEDLWKETENAFEFLRDFLYEPFDGLQNFEFKFVTHHS